MKAVILAAGRGTRLGGTVKPLLKVAGRRIIDRTIILLSPYVDEFVIVAHSRKIEEYLEKNWKGKIRYRIVWNPEPEKGNGYSFYLAGECLKQILNPDEKFVLVMGDHVYSKEFVERAIEGEGLICDCNPKYIDVDEATKVKCSGGRIEDIGKNLKSYDCVDTGFFILTPEIFSVAEEAVREKEVIGLSEIVGRAKLKVTHISGLFWMDVDTKDELKKARKCLVRLAGVKSYGDGFISRNLNRRLSLLISERIVDFATPNQLTILTFLFGIFSALVALVNIPLGGILYQINSILDGMDGEVARASLRTSKFGGWLDSILDRYVDFAFLVALAIASKAWLISLFALIGSVMVSYSTERYKAAYFEDIYRKIPVMRYLPGKRDERIFVIMVFCLLGYIVELLWLLAVLTNLRVLVTMLAVWRYGKR
ncbi:bifunctional L-myo-inositol-1-phosphate cytidylyltransferase/CDP-L-myo-inositol myo-inositolphosphotransferase [Archaeoglobus veneficus]|uniref:Bifunctional IPC transferase and DIPP synthase n=1 Tax=Archaeoglobus veneficus (strain DSM 11195 / SNP6) TaxID=693661 RepID=F2KS67_ARCVS|nr:bifunctional L-myo-inositol-1-phosphate cytidylyltransferase/CDP-L-myo-inositol myo-inositolphosphotransferase [Archaeoglobus veneficus]AEA48006.1 CDP-alcohol phosphatidyltransferase [Archaeoglobus veneficus SNP6]